MLIRKLLSKTIGALAVSVVAFAPESFAQDAPDRQPRTYCWRGQPEPACNGFLLTEFNFFRSVVTPSATVPYYFAADSSPQAYYEIRDQPWNLTWEVGGMVNTSTRNALGVTLLIGANGDGATVGIKGRYRRWLNPEGIALDVGAGVRTSSSDRGVYAYTFEAPYRAPGPSPALTADVAINARDYVALVGRIDLAKFGGRYQPNISLGVRAGSKPAVIATGALATTYAVLITVFLLAWND